MMRFLIPVAVGALMLAGCSSPSGSGTQSGSGDNPTSPNTQGKKVRIGVSLPAPDHGWTGGAVWWAKQAMAMYPDIEFDLQTASKPEEQVSQIETMMQKGVDGLVILATESAPLTPVAEQAYNKDILVVNVDRGFLKPVAHLFIEGDNKAFGRKSAEYMVEKLGGKGNAKGNIVILEGIPSTVNSDRVNSALEVFSAEPGIKIVARQSGKWNKDEAMKVTETILQQNPQIDAIWASDDDMAEGVEVALKSSGRINSNIWVLGGAGKKEVVKRVMDGDKLFPADITYPPSMTALAVHNAVSILRDGKRSEIMKFTPRHMKIDVDLITPENAKDYYFPDAAF